MSIAYSTQFMQQAIAMAQKAGEDGAVPVAALIVHQGQIIARAANAPQSAHDPTGHAEIIALRAAAKSLGSERLNDCDLWVTLEPCAMCAGAIAHARIRRLYYAASDPKGGAIEHGPRLFTQPTIHHQPEIYSGICEEQAAQLLTDFFKNRR